MSKEGQYSKLYTTKRWRALRQAQLLSEPLCRMCQEIGRFVTASVVDHIEPHKGDMDKFWSGPFQSLCNHCHNSHKKRLESGGGVVGCDLNGFPIDPAHHWQAGG